MRRALPPKAKTGGRCGGPPFSWSKAGRRGAGANVAPVSEPFSPEREYAGWWRRVGAYLLDSLLVTVVVLVVGGVLYALIGDAGLVIAYVLIFLGPFAYFTYFHGRPGGQTPGKSALGIRVRREDGGDLGYGRALARYAFTVVLSILVIPLLIDYLWPLWDARNQSLHDKIAKSVVQLA
jgi:uncharacterized RDD family membrane protein YckC